MKKCCKEKLGEGGYGGVYKLLMSTYSYSIGILFESQGKALNYEFLTNGSLDRHIYNQNSNMGWKCYTKLHLG